MARRSASLLFFLLLLFAGPVLAQAPRPAALTLQDAIASGKVTAEFNGTGGSSGDSVKARLAKGPKAGPGPLAVDLPSGSELESNDAAAQNMMVAAVRGVDMGGRMIEPASRIVLTGNKPVTYVLGAFCVQFEKQNPSPSTSFTLRGRDPVLACIARQTRTLSVEAIQAAVWMHTDNVTFGHINEKFPVSGQDWAAAQKAFQTCQGAASNPGTVPAQTLSMSPRGGGESLTGTRQNSGKAPPPPGAEKPPSPFLGFQSSEFRSALGQALHARYDGFAALGADTSLFQLPGMNCSLGAVGYRCLQDLKSSVGGEQQSREFIAAVSSALPAYSMIEGTGQGRIIRVIYFLHQPGSVAGRDATIFLFGDPTSVALEIVRRGPADKGEPAEFFHALALERLGDYKKALDEFVAIGVAGDNAWLERARVESDSGGAKIQSCQPVLCGLALLSQDRLQDALDTQTKIIEAQERANKKFPDSGGTQPLSYDYDVSAKIQAAMGRLVPALRDVDFAISSLPKNATTATWEALFYYDRALILVMGGRYADGAKVCGASLDIDPIDFVKSDCQFIAGLAANAASR
jgi:hypothetical protein